MKNESPKVISSLARNNDNDEVINCLIGEITPIKNDLLDDAIKNNALIRWGLKDPALQYYLDDLLINFPMAQYVLIIRDGRAVALSKLKAKFGTANIHYAAEKWKEEIEKQKQFYSKNNESCCLVYYEDLVLYPERELRRVCEFLGEEFEDSMLRYYENDSYVERTNKFNINTSKKLDSSIITKWRNELSEYKINLFETIAGDVLLENNYELTGKRIEFPEWHEFFFRIHQKIVAEFQLQYQVRVKPVVVRCKVFIGLKDK